MSHGSGSKRLEGGLNKGFPLPPTVPFIVLSLILLVAYTCEIAAIGVWNKDKVSEMVVVAVCENVIYDKCTFIKYENLGLICCKISVIIITAISKYVCSTYVTFARNIRS